MKQLQSDVAACVGLAIAAKSFHRLYVVHQEQPSPTTKPIEQSCTSRKPAQKIKNDACTTLRLAKDLKHQAQSNSKGCHSIHLLSENGI